MINPGDIETLFGAGMTAGKIVLGGTVYSVLCGYVVLQTLRLSSAAERKSCSIS